MFSLEIQPYILKFRFDAGTSRGILKEKKVWLLVLRHSDFPGREGRGEAGILPGLSPENPETFASDLRKLADFILPQMETMPRNWQRISARWLENWHGAWLPSALFALETAWLDWVNGGKELICDADFHAGLSQVPINGLVWMNERREMEKQAREKRDVGFDTIKFKVGALDWQIEQGQYAAAGPGEAVLRLDALAPPLALRPWRRGDRMRPLGLGGSKLVSDLLTEARVPRNMKPHAYVLQSADHIAWLVGVRVAEGFQAGAGPGPVVRFRVGEPGWYPH